MPTLSEYLRNRNVILDPLDLSSVYTEEEKTLISGIGTDALNALINARIRAVGYELMIKAIPEEVPVLRQVLVELEGIKDDHFKVVEDRKRNTPPQETPEPSPPVEVGGEGSV